MTDLIYNLSSALNTARRLSREGGECSVWVDYDSPTNAWGSHGYVCTQLPPGTGYTQVARFIDGRYDRGAG